ncbi:hypothetical protein K474DRAFT_1407479 [Panus rudis PR-1116 ss-1]|nr:hypothetical protein K474DRAFT_1407479 [Panus rudis PR-1116 ss-1]
MPPSPTPSQATVETNSSLFIPPSSSTPDSFGTPNSFSTAQNLPRGGLSRRATVEESLDETERQRPVIRDARQVRWASSPEVIEHTGGYADSDVPTLQDGEYVMSGSPTATKSKRKRRHSLITSTQEESSSNKSLESLELSWRQLPHSIPPRPTRDSTYAYSPDPSEHVSSRHGYAWYPSQGIPPGSIYARDYARYQSPRLRQRASLLPYGGRPAISVPPPPSAGRYSVYELGLRSQTPQPTLTHDTPFLPFITGDNRPHYTAFDNGIQYIQQGEWQTLADTLRIHDHGQIESCDKSIDALLVFTGLFSAVVAAFTIESYKSLQEDPSITSAAFLALISRQLSDLASGSSQTSTSTPAPSFKAAPSDVRINAAWFTSLVCSLVTASLALFVKQCLRNYLHGHYSSPQERIRVRHFRYQGLIRWRVFELAAALPLLLQLGLLLFLLGMSEFLRPLDLAVGWTITGLIILWLMAVVLIVFAPAVSSDCPYRIPILINVATSIRGLIARLRFGRKWRARMGYTNGYYAFPGDEKGLRREVLQNCLRYCCANLDPRDSLRFICRVVENRIGKPVRSIADFDEYHLIPTRALNALTEMMCDTLENISSSSGTVLQPEDDPVHSSWHCYVDLVTGLSRIVDHAVTKERQAHVVAWGRARGLVANAPANFLDEKENTEPYIRILMKMNTKPLINPSHLVEARMLNFLNSPYSALHSNYIFRIGPNPQRSYQEKMLEK